MGMKALSLNDALATPMYDAFSAKPLNSTPYDAIPAKVDLLTRNTAAAPWAALSNRLPFADVDAVPQVQSDAIPLGRRSTERTVRPPPPGPNAEKGE